MSSKGIIVGCDKGQEWLLPWWWEYYTAHNSFPVAFADFGMSKKGIEWCLDKGDYLNIPTQEILGDHEIPLRNKQIWEKLYGKETLKYRHAWFKKPLALLQSPFSLNLWLDLDCQINGGLDPLFNSLTFGAEIGLVREPNFVQELLETQNALLPGEIYYNSGVIVFRKGADIVHRFAEEAFSNNAEHAGDQHALCRAIFKHQPSLVELPLIYNWSRMLGTNPKAIIFHHTGGLGKVDILEVIRQRVSVKN
ncbi:MAG: hypothetical protein JSR57_11700 [Verrucomicrobia bacterium]|nr:hypothetical protein [Verrucomicrobiota bacterium]